MEYRKAWAKNWDSVKYCSDRCRRQKKGPDDTLKILEALKKQALGSTICPSDILIASEKQDHEIMERVRSCARKLAAAGVIEITQKGVVVDPLNFRGPIRLRLKR
jgi:hypothetical protein